MMLCVWLGCGGDQGKAPGELIVVFDTQLAIPQDIDQMDVELSSGGAIKFARSYQLGGSDLRLPSTLGLVSSTDQSPIVRINAVARKNGEARIIRSAIATIPMDFVASLRISLEYLCLDQVVEENSSVRSSCPDGETCVNGQCKNIQTSTTITNNFSNTAVFYTDCFDLTPCLATSKDYTDKITETQCSFAIPKPAKGVNVVLGLPPNMGGLCDDSSCYVTLYETLDWTYENGLLTLADGICKSVLKQDTKLLVADSCETKPLGQPICGLGSSSDPSTNPPPKKKICVDPDGDGFGDGDGCMGPDCNQEDPLLTTGNQANITNVILSATSIEARSPLDISFDYQIVDDEACPNCTHALVFGYYSDNTNYMPDTQCAYEGSAKSCAAGGLTGKRTHSAAVPNQPGTYELRAFHESNTTCALLRSKVYQEQSPTIGQRLGTITVLPPSVCVESYTAFSNVTINAIPTFRYETTPGATFTLGSEFFLSQSNGCPSCVIPLAIGFPGSRQGCPYLGIPGVCPNPTTGAGQPVPILAPTMPGVYPITSNTSQVFNCEDVGIGTGPSLNNFAVIVVK
jgi:hypothetical protein